MPEYSFSFTPDHQQIAKELVPYIEDVRASEAKYYSTTFSETRCRDEVSKELSLLGAGLYAFEPGIYGESSEKRYGYRIRFNYMGKPGIIRVAGLRIRKLTDKKIEQVRKQALLNVRDWLYSARSAQTFSPGTSMLIMHLVVGPDDTTVADYITQSGSLPNPQALKFLGGGMTEPIDGEIVIP